MLVPLLLLVSATADRVEAPPSPAARPRPDATATRTPSPFLIPSVVVRRAYRYAGSGNLSARPRMQLVAVDVEFHDIDRGLDLDDVEIIDAATGRVLEAGPEIAFLRADGSFYSWRKAPPDGPMRSLLIFEIPRRVRAIRLQLSDDILTRSPVEIAPSGPTLPAERPDP